LMCQSRDFQSLLEIHFVEPNEQPLTSKIHLYFHP
jgi:hypothetical protein